MQRLNPKIIFIFLSGCFLTINPSLGKCLNGFCNNIKEINNEEQKGNLFKTDNRSSIYLKIGKEVDINQILMEETKDIKLLFKNILFSNLNEPPKEYDQFSFDIESDSQYIIDDVVYAEGNVLIFLPYGIFKAEKISFDRKNKIFKAFDNLEFDKGSQYLSADYLHYDLKNNIGKIENVYGIINFNRINNDLGLNLGKVENLCNQEELDLIDNPSEIELLNSTNLRLKKSASLQAFSFDLSKINQWRFKSEEIIFNNDKWNSDLIYFTNDPLNKAQFIVESKDFSAEIVSGKKIFKSKSTSIDFDGKFKLPIGKRTIADSNAKSYWGFGYKNKNKDGFFISRNIDSINLADNFFLDLKPYFLLQRAINSHSNSFREKNASVISEDIKTNVNFLDYFALNAKLKGNYNEYIFESDLDLKTFNIDRFYDAFIFDFNLKRNIYSSNNPKNNSSENCNNSDNPDIIENFVIDMGSYTVFNKDDLYLGYGLKIINMYKYKDERIKKNYSLILDFGQFKGESLLEKNRLEQLTRAGYNLTLGNKYKLLNLNKNKKVTDYKLKNIPESFEEGLFFDAKIASSFYEYSNSKNQNIISFSFGPTLIYGDLNRNYLDYIKLSIQPELTIKDNQSPFKFDDFNNDSRIKIVLDQQLYGPIIIGFEGDYNINTNSLSYGFIENKIYNLKLSRRAYLVNLKYFESDKALAFGFEIFNFGFDSKSSKF